MREFRKKVIYSLIPVAAVVVTIVIVSLIRPSGEPEVSPSPSPYLRPVADFITGSNDNMSDSMRATESVTLTAADGSSLTIVSTAVSEDLVDYKLEKASDIMPYDNEALAMTLAYAGFQTSNVIVDENATEQELSDYGFDEPQLTWTVKRTSGASVSYELGDLVASGDYYYARSSGGTRVYIMSKNSGDLLMKKEQDYFKLDIVPVYNDSKDDGTEDSIGDHLQNIRFTQRNGTKVEMRPISAEEKISTMPYAPFMIVSPYTAYGNSYYIEELVSKRIGTIKPSEVVEYAPEGLDLSKYSLDAPLELFVSDNNNWSMTLLIGGIEPKSGGRYITLKDSNAVLLDKTGDYSFLDLKPIELRNRLVLYDEGIKIDNISKVVFETDAGVRTLYISKYENNEATATFAGKDISSANVKKLLNYTTTKILIDGEDKEAELGVCVFGATIYLRDDSQHNIKLYAINERQYVIEKDGVNERFFTNAARVKDLIGAFEILDRGGSLK